MPGFEIDVDVHVDLKEPSLYDVILLNDDYTPIDFVIELLKQVFGHDQASAEEITMNIHMNGKGAAGTYSYEIAHQKQIDATTAAKRFEHPLRIVLEEQSA